MRKIRGFSVALILSALISVPANPQNQHKSSSDEYSVYEAVLGLMDRLPVEDPHVTIDGMTLNTKCGEEAYPSPLANGCTFLWIKPDTANSVQKLLHEDWAGFEKSTWSDFETKNAASVRLQEPIAA